SVSSKNSPRCDHPDGRTASLHRMNLHRRRLRAQGKAIGRVERILRCASRMILRNIQRAEVIEIRFNLAVVFYRVSQRDKNVFDALTQKIDRMKMAAPWTPAGKRHIDALALEPCNLNVARQRPFSAVKFLDDIRFGLLRELAESGTLFG